VAVYATDSAFNLSDSSAVVRLYSDDRYAVVTPTDTKFAPYPTYSSTIDTLTLQNGSTVFYIDMKTANDRAVNTLNQGDAMPQKYSLAIATHMNRERSGIYCKGQSGSVPVDPNPDRPANT